MAHLTPKEILARAKEFLQGAEEADRFNVGAICSYAALFWAARAALAFEGFDRPTREHSELRARFTDELIKNRRRYPQSFGTWLVNGFRLRNFAQYHFDHPQVKKIRRMVYHSKQFILKVEEVTNK